MGPQDSFFSFLVDLCGSMYHCFIPFFFKIVFIYLFLEREQRRENEEGDISV